MKHISRISDFQLDHRNTTKKLDPIKPKKKEREKEKMSTIKMDLIDYSTYETLSLVSKKRLVGEPMNYPLIVFDWDDTLFPTYWLASRGITMQTSQIDIPKEIYIMCKKLEMMVKRLLEQATRLGKVIIVTNAEIGWVEMTAERFMPSLLPLLNSMYCETTNTKVFDTLSAITTPNTNYVEIISARTMYENIYGISPQSWKIQAFQKLINNYEETNKMYEGFGFPLLAKRVLHVISIGDSEYERHAVHHATKRMATSAVKTKSIKLINHPHVKNVMHQVKHIYRQLPQIVGHYDSFDSKLHMSVDV